MSPLLEAIDRYVVGSLSKQRRCVDVDGFRLFLSPETPMIYANYAVPTRAGTGLSEVRAMVAAFHKHESTPRLEFRAETNPLLSKSLEAAGFELEAEQPLMACDRALFVPQVSSNVEVERLGADSDFVGFLAVANEAFGMDEPLTPERVELSRKSVLNGHWMMALGRIDGEPAGTGYLGPFEGVAELAGIGTRPVHRRKGVAQTVSSVLMRDFFDQGGELAWLSTGDDTAKAVYERLGFRTVGTQMNYVLAS